MASMVDSRARVPRVCSSSTALTVLSSDVTLVTITCERRADGGGRGKRTNQSHLLLFFSILPAQSTNERNGYTTRHERVSRSWSTSSWLVGGWLARYARQSETKKKTNKQTHNPKEKEDETTTWPNQTGATKKGHEEEENGVHAHDVRTWCVAG